MMIENKNENNKQIKNQNENLNVNEYEQIKQNINFFNYIQNNNLPEIIKLFRNKSIKPWEFISEEDISGKIK
jgi:hypothetical protein